MKIIGLTGSSGSGKTLISEIIEKKYNAKILKADEIVKKAQKISKPYYKAIVKIFGVNILDYENKIDRKKLANKICYSKEDLEKLNKLTYKYIARDMIKEIKSIKKLKNNDMIIIDAPLLIESKLNKLCDLIIAVIAPFETKIERIIKRDNLTKAEAIDRLKIQKTDEFYIKNSDYIIKNKDIKTIQDLEDEISIIFLEQLKK